MVTNVPWLAKVLRDVVTEAPDRCGNELACLHDDTQLWADRTLLSTGWELVPLETVS